LNLHGIVSPAIGAINPQVLVTVKVSTGYVTNPDKSRTPTFNTILDVPAQIQALTYGDLQKLQGLTMNGERRAIYLNGRFDSLNRVSNQGGDLIIFPDRTTWLVAMSLEFWPDWCKLAATLQSYLS
jgi:hypothetical protein